MKTTEPGTNPQLTLRSGLRQGLRQRYILTGISILLTLSACILYWMLQQKEAAAEVVIPKANPVTEVSAIPEIQAAVEVVDNVPVLRWEGEFPNATMFVIERATDNDDWQLVQKAPREEVMLQDNSFRFSDEEAEGIRLRYRISCLSPAGSVLTTTEVEATTQATVSQLLTITAIEPLPFNNQFSITLEAEKEEVISFEILDNNSEPVYTEVYHVKKGDNLIGFTRGEQLSKGVYIIRLTGSDDAVAMTRLIKQ